MRSPIVAAGKAFDGHLRRAQLQDAYVEKGFWKQAEPQRMLL